jgi:hypothetical protein
VRALVQLLDVEKEEAVVAEGVGSFDIIFATNVLHATRNMSNTLLNCKVNARGCGHTRIYCGAWRPQNDFCRICLTDASAEV